MKVECFPDAPEDWMRGPIEQFARVAPRYPLDTAKMYPFVEMANVAEQFGGIRGFDWRKPEGSGLARFKVNDILFGKITPCAENGKVALVRSLPDEFGLGSTEFIVLSPKVENDPRYVFSLLCSGPVHGRAVSRMEGSTGRLRITEDTFTRWLHVALPASPEQRAIAAILDAADAAIERTSEALSQTGRLRDAILQRFFRDALGPISSADRPGKMIAKGWRLVPTRELLAEEPKNGVSPPAESQPPGNPTFSIAAVRDGRIDLMNQDHLKYVRIEPKIATKYAVHAGDILVVRGNANPNLVGKCGMITDFPEGCIYPDILKRIVFADREDGVLPHYATLVWNHPLVHNQVLKRAQTSNGTLKINSRDVKQMVLPVPPKDRQVDLLRVIRAQEELMQALTRKVDILHRLKRGLMQDLLTGRVRVPASLEVADA
jgi:type I restriction enzyme S subunit